jgi:hypothetical protein
MYIHYGNGKMFHVEHFVDLPKASSGTDEGIRVLVFWKKVQGTAGAVPSR